MGARARHKPGVMNKLEAAYAEVLEGRKQSGEIIWYAFEAMKFVLAKRTTYMPDFIVQLADGEVEVHEVKGFWEGTARVKIKCAAEKFPFQFIAIKRLPKKDGGDWVTEKF